MAVLASLPMTAVAYLLYLLFVKECMTCIDSVSVCMCIRACVCVCATVDVWKSEDNSWS